MIRVISILFAKTKRFPSFLTNNVATPFSRLESTPFLPPVVSHAKFGWELIRTPPKPSLEHRRTSLSVFSSISWDIVTTFFASCVRAGYPAIMLDGSLAIGHGQTAKQGK